MTDQIQPIESIVSLDKEQQKEEVLLDPAQEDYKKGRELLSKGDLAQAAMLLH